MAYNKIAEEGNIFVLTKKGYDKTPCEVKHERKIGNPVKGFEYKVPVQWVEKGYVKQAKEVIGSAIDNPELLEVE